MSWALRNQTQVRNVFLGIGALLIVACLLLNSAPLIARLELVAISLAVWPLAFYGVRAVLQLQLWQHGLRPWIRAFAAAGFFFFGAAAIIAIPLTVVPSPVIPLPIAFVMFASASYSMIATISRAERTQHATPAS